MTRHTEATGLRPKEVLMSNDTQRRKVGTFKTLADGTIKVSVSHGTNINGRQRRVSGYARTQEEAELLALDLATQLGRRPDLGNGVTLERWWRAYTVDKGRRLTKATYKRYELDMQRIWLPALGDTDISLITRKDVQDVLLTLPTRSAASHAKSALSAVLTQAVRYGRLSENPIREGGFELPGDVGAADDSGVDYDDDPFGAIEHANDVWDARTVLRAMPLLEGLPLETCWLAMVGAGLRREEALALRWKDVRRIEIDGRDVTQIAVHRALTNLDGIKRTKTRQSVRIVAVVEPFGRRLWELHGEPDDMVCQVSVSNVQRRWANMWEPCESKHARKKDRRKGIMLEAGIPFITLARMRATHESYMQQAGVLDSVNAAAHGHSERVSYRYYQRSTDIDAAQAAGDYLVHEGGKSDYAKRRRAKAL